MVAGGRHALLIVSRSRRGRRPDTGRAAEPAAPVETLDSPGDPPPAPAPHAWARPAAFGWVALVGAVLLALAFGLHHVADNYTETDFIGGYVPGARGLLAGHLDASRYAVAGPVYEIVLAATGAAMRNFESAGKLISVTAACGALLLWFLTIESRAGALAGLWTVLFLAVNPVFVRYGSSATTDMLAMGTQAAALYALFGGRGRNGALIAGVLSGLSVLTRYNAVYLVPAFLWSDAWRESPDARARARTALGFAAGFAAPTLPWLAFSISSGHLPGEGLFQNLAFDVYAHAKGITWDEYAARMGPGFGSLWDVLSRSPADLLHRLVENLRDHVVLDVQLLLGWPAAIACAAGLPFALPAGGWRKLLPLWAAGALLYLTLVPVFHSERYSLPLAPIYLSLAGMIGASPFFAVTLRGRRVPLAPVLALTLLAASAAYSVRYQQQVLRDLPVEVRPAAEALRVVAPPGSKVLARKPHIGFYSGVTQVPFPAVSTLPELAGFCRQHGIDFLYYSTPEADTRPEFTYLLDREADVPGLVPIPFEPPGRARLYRIVDGFGASPAWFSIDSLRTLRVSRSLASIGAPAWRAALVSGIFAMQSGDYADAGRHFLHLTRMRPDFAQGFFLAGESHRLLGRYDIASAAYQRALVLEPEMHAAREGLGWSLLLAGDVSGAASAWAPIASLVQDTTTLNRMVQVFASVGDLQAARLARESMERAAGSAP